MCNFARRARLLLALAVVLCGAANASELAVLVTGSMADPLEGVGADFTAATGHTVRFTRGTTAAVVARLRANEPADVVVLAAEAAAELERDRTLAAATLTPVASSVFAVVVRADGALPDVSTAAALKDVVAAAQRIAYPDPDVATVSGGYIEQVLSRLGIAASARAKATLTPMGYLVGEAVQRGEVELGLSFASEFTANPALAVVLFPAELQRQQLYAAGVLATAANAAVAREFVAFITSAEAARKLAAAGVVPVARP